MGRPKKYFSREERLEARKEYDKLYRESHKEQRAEYDKLYRPKYNQTPMGRAVNLVNAYKQLDTKYNRGECTLTAKWIVENIFSQPCHYNCGESDWKKMGCDRIDNSKPHTPDNVVPCCAECNIKRGLKTYEEFYNL